MISKRQTLPNLTIPHADRTLSPAGLVMTFDDLPPADTSRWVASRKAEVVAGVRAGLISLEEACRRYSLSVDEFLSWRRRLDEHGLDGLRATGARKRRRRGTI